MPAQHPPLLNSGSTPGVSGSVLRQMHFSEVRIQRAEETKVLMSYANFVVGREVLAMFPTESEKSMCYAMTLMSPSCPVLWQWPSVHESS